MGTLQERDHVNQKRFHYLGPSRLCAGGRFDRSGTCYRLCPFGCDDGVISAISRVRNLSRRRSSWIPRRVFWIRHILGEEHYGVVQRVQGTLQKYKDLQDIIAILGMDELSEDDKQTVARARKLTTLLVPTLPCSRSLYRISREICET